MRKRYFLYFLVSVLLFVGSYSFASFAGDFSQKPMSEQEEKEIFVMLISKYDKDLKQHPEDTETLLCRGICYSFIGEYKKAVADFNKLS